MDSSRLYELNDTSHAGIGQEEQDLQVSSTSPRLPGPTLGAPDFCSRRFSIWTPQFLDRIQGSPRQES
ncbi:hypothetical protein K1T71_002908 [Dendrolimus kikuchii]|uniref:Uncharacterized protein n=1 Tax=Dendrolimus kikuchii TaxID=765133 RepID=A0ACC1DB43_9NEOP|nr:hypothetical protein K1T71_002908 [Dendrolimus kikuchii]